jgi:hypothetical protein
VTRKMAALLARTSVSLLSLGVACSHGEDPAANENAMYAFTGSSERDSS